MKSTKFIRLCNLYGLNPIKTLSNEKVKKVLNKDDFVINAVLFELYKQKQK